jgi:glucosyl-3-phosphoglycerate synthase
MTNINKWLKEHTYHHSQFSDIKELVRLKNEKNLKISLCFPTLNEEKTIGKEIVIIKSELMDRHPLLDEIAVIDSGSTDKTIEVAKEFGAKTFLASDYLPEEGEMKGKGENLWKAIYLLEGDIIIFLDADISNIHPKFVYGILGPLLIDDSLKYVKAFYDRPLGFSKDGKKKNQGGRTTEILIRPLFSQFFPELSGFIQPLSGEFAGYRDVFEQIPFPIGYGVETSHLIDIAQKWGVESMAQTDLDQRIHRNQDTKRLGKMSFGILQTFWNRLYLYKNIGPIEPTSLVMRQIEKSDGDNEEQEIIEMNIVERERKPMIEIEGYLKKKNQ